MSFEPEQNLMILLGLLFSFLLTNYNAQLGTAYIAILLVAYISIDDNPAIKIRLFKPGPKDWTNILLWAVVGYVVFYYGTGFVLKSFFNMQANFGLGALVFEQSKILQILSIGVLIPIVETIVFFMALPQVYAKLSNSVISNKLDSATIIGILAVSAAFTIFHANVRGITNTPGLMTSFMFSLVSMALVVWRGQAAEAVGLHIINNVHALGVLSL